MSWKRKAIVGLAAAVAALAQLAVAPPAHGEPRPSSDVLVPYFEVGLVPKQDVTTLFSVANQGRREVAVTIAVHTNWGIPVLQFPHLIGAGEVHSVNLHDWLVDGKVFERQLTAAELAHLQAALSGEPSPRDGLWYGSEVTPGVAVGYVTIRTNGGGRPDVLWGDYFIADLLAGYFQGDTLAGIDVQQCDAPCKRHVVRFLEGGQFKEGTELIIWTGKRWNPSPWPDPRGVDPVELRGLAYDEPGQLVARRDLPLRPLATLEVSQLNLPVEFGWFDLSTDVPSVISVHFTESQTSTSSALHSYCITEALGDAIELRKKVNGEDADQPGLSVPVGKPLEWEYVVTNLSRVTLTGVEVEDDSGLTVSCPQDTLAPGATMTCTATSVAEPCEHVNTASVVGWKPDNTPLRAEDRAYYRGSFSAALRIKKAVNGDDADLPPGPQFSVGTPLQFTFEVSNSGDVELTGVAVSDDAGLTVTCPKSVLQPGETMTCTAAAVAAPGNHRDVGTVHGHPPCGPEVSAADPAHYSGGAEGIRLKKFTNGEDADQAPGPTLEPGAPVVWTYQVTNEGGAVLVDVGVTDDRGVVVTCPKTTLQPGESMTCSGRGTAQVCQYRNLGVAAATIAGQPGIRVSGSDVSHYFGRHAPAVVLIKLTEGSDGPDLLAGDPVHWTYRVINTGNVALTAVSVSDDQGAAVSCPKNSLAPGESMTCTAQGIAVTGHYRNIGTVTAVPPCGPPVTAADASWYVGHLPGLTLEKLTNGLDTSQTCLLMRVGEPILWSYVATNTGDVRLTNLALVDDQGLAITCPQTTLAPGEAVTCTATSSALLGEHRNVARATARAASKTLSAVDTGCYRGVQPAIRLEKKVNGEEADLPPGPLVIVGGTVTWTFEVTNSGDVPLSRIVLSDDGAPVACPKSSLEPGETMICTTTGTALKGQHHNQAMVVGEPSVGPPVIARDPANYLGVEPQIELRKKVNGRDADSPPGPMVLTGSTVNWAFLVTNTGDVQLENVVVTDQGSVVPCPRTVLAPGESMTCNTSGTAINGQYHNVATVVGVPPVGQPVSVSDHGYYLGVRPRIELEKLVNGDTADTPPGPMLLAGSPINWTFEVRNSGDVQLGSIVLTDEGTTVTCPKTLLAPGEAMTCTATGVVLCGQHQNVAMVLAVTPMGGTVTATDPAHYFGVRPGISVEKLVNGHDADTPPGPQLIVGSAILWAFVVVNTGTVKLTDVKLFDDGVLLSCPKAELEPGEDMTCIAAGVAELGQHANLAVVGGQPVAGGPRVTAQDPAYYTGINRFQGCTPGYWKNHPGAWSTTGYTPTQLVGGVFTAAVRFPDLAAATLLQALNFAGGSTDQGAAEILLRSAVAALLNATHQGVAYPRTPAEVVAAVNAALVGSRADMLALAAALDRDNNLGCPL